MSADLTGLSIAEMRAGLDAGDFSARELVGAHVAAMEEARVLNAFITETPEAALAAAEAADAARARGEAPRPLAGIPLGIKDLFCTEGVRTTAASRILADFRPPYESTVTARLKAAGAAFLGSSTSTSSPWAPPTRPRPSGRCSRPGARAGRTRRSSRAALGRLGGGSGCRLVAGATGTDTGGSIRQPAAFTRHLWPEAHLRPLLALGDRGLRLLARPGRTHGPDGRRLRAPP
jgi:aspartyl/glutamyl-tRNA(Asn/Gln) amidotransferase subunit A (EC 6.3.5.-)